LGLTTEVSPKVVLLSGGTGGAKFACGLQDICGENLTVIANTADDIEIYGSYVSPDPDLICYWLSDQIDERGWGIAGDTFTVMDELKKLGTDVWFRLGDRDLAACLHRKELLDAGLTLTETIQILSSTLKVPAKVLPMTDSKVRTWVSVDGSSLPLQRYLIQGDQSRAVQSVELDGIDKAQASDQVLAAISSAELIFIGPSNPVISIEPILNTGGIRDALRDSNAPVVAVSPIVEGAVLKGPTAQMLTTRGLSVDAQGIADIYSDSIDALICDEPTTFKRIRTLTTSTLMDTADQRYKLAKDALDFALDTAPQVDRSY